MQYRREIDGLRALAVVPVVLFHAGFQSFSGGFVGVDVFFVISGYLITSILIMENERDSFSIVNFYERRARRILPALFLVMLACLPFAWLWMLPDNLVEFGNSLIAVTFFVSNFLFWKESGYFAAAAEEKPLLHTWSLAVEEQYYLLFPLLIMLIWPLGRRWLAIVLIIGIAASLVMAEWGWRYKPDANFYLAPFRAWELLIGSLIALYLSRRADLLRGNQWLAAVGAVMVIYSIVAFDQLTPFPSLWALLPVVGTGLIILFATPQTWIGQLLSTGPLVGIGLISYSVYLWHQPLFAFARIRMLGGPEPLTYVLLAALSVFLGWVSWRWIERPFRDKTMVSRRGIFTFAGLGMLFFAIAGAAIVYSQGAPQRFAAVDRDIGMSLAERAQYVVRRHEALAAKTQFDADDRKNILIVGDSFSQDFVNILAETVELQNLDVATHFVPTVCQLYVGPPAGDRIRPSDAALCQQPRQLPSQLVASADLVFLSFMWHQWTLEALPETLKAIDFNPDARLVVVGRKHFGHVNRSALIHIPFEARGSYTVDVADYVIDNNRLGRSLDLEYLDMHAAICGASASKQCPLFDRQGQLLSHDGEHVTEAGAKYAAQAIAARLTALLE